LFAVVESDGTRNNNPKRFIPTEKAVEILEDCAAVGVRAIQFTGGGEPTVHPDYLFIMQKAVSLGMDISLVTNGVLLDSEVIDFLARRATWVRVSMDAAFPATYARIRRVSESQYFRAVKAIQGLVDEKRRNNSDLTIGIGFVVTKDNYEEVSCAAALASDWCVDNFRISAVFQPDNEAYFKDFYEEASFMCRLAEKQSSIQVINYFGDRISDLKQQSPDYQTCYQQQFATYIGDDLNVYRCCNTAYNDRGLIGSIANQRFRDLWESQAKRDDFAAFDARGCRRCQFNAQNRAIRSLVEPATHVNFV